MKKIVLIALAALAAVACFLALRQSDDLESLKSMGEVAGDGDGMFELVRKIVAAARNGDAKKLEPFMLIRDATELERISAPLLEKPDLGELEFLGCTKLTGSSRENLGVHVYSAARKQSYAFYFLKDAKGEYKLSEIGLSKRKP